MRGEALFEQAKKNKRWIFGAGSTLLTAYGIIRLGQDDIDRDTLRWTGAALAGGSGLFLTKKRYFPNRDFEGTEKVSNKTRLPHIIGVVGTLAFAGSFLGGSDGGTESTTNSNATFETVVDTTSPDTGSPQTQSSDSSAETEPAFPCEITAPIAPDDVDGVKRLQAYLNAQGFDAGPEDGQAGAQTSEAVDRLQTALGIDPAARWDAQTCSLTPFGDGDPNTP